MKDLRERIENLIIGTYNNGAGGTITPNKFILGSSMRDVDNSEMQLERNVWVEVQSRKNGLLINRLDQYGYWTFPVKIYISYIFDPAGDDQPENLYSELQGGTNMSLIRDRALSDVVEIESVITDHQNWGGLGPKVEIISIETDLDKDPALDFNPLKKRAILEMNYEAKMQIDFSYRIIS